MDFVCADLAHGISALYKVSMLIQHPATPDRLEKYIKFPVSHYVDYERQRLKQKYPCLVDSNVGGGLTFLGGRLVQANLRRRQIFLYASSHHEKIATSGDGHQITPSGKPKESVVRRLQHQATSIGFSDAPHQLTDHTRSQTTATVFVEPHFKAAGGPHSLLPFPQAPSEYSSSMGSSVASVDEADDSLLRTQYCIPPRPNRSTRKGDRSESECPYCFKIIRVFSENRWKYVPSLCTPRS